MVTKDITLLRAMVIARDGYRGNPLLSTVRKRLTVLFVTEDQIREAATIIGRRNAAKMNASLTPEQRSASARRAALARWAPRIAAGWVAIAISEKKNLKKGVNYGR